MLILIIFAILDSPYTDRINKAFLGFLNDGTLNLLEEKWMKKNYCSNEKVNSTIIIHMVLVIPLVD